LCGVRSPPVNSSVRWLSELNIKVKILFLILILLIEANAGFALECRARRGVSEELKHSTIVFSGKAVAEEYRPIITAPPGWPEGGEILVIKFSVARWWKGSVEEEVFLYTGVSRWPGGYRRIAGEDFGFKVGEQYLVYAFGENEHLVTTECERTTKLEKAAEDLKELGEGRLPEKRKAKVSLVRRRRTKPCS